MGDGMNDIIQSIANFYSTMVSTLTGASPLVMATFSATAVWAGVATIYFLYQWLNWVGEESGGPKIVVYFFKTYSFAATVWFFAVSAPVIVMSLTAWSGAKVQAAANGPMVASTNKLFNQMLDTTGSMAELIPAYADAMVDATPGLNVLDQSSVEAVSGLSDAQKFQAAQNAIMARDMALRDLRRQLDNAKKLAASNNPDQARIGQELVGTIQTKITESENTIRSLQEQTKTPPAAARDDGIMGSILGTLKGGIKILLAPIDMTVGATIKALYMLAAIASLGPGILLGLWGAWKLIGAAVELFTYCFAFAAKVACGGLVSTGYAPVALLTFLFPASREYGRHFVSWWVQLILGAFAFGVIVQLGAYGVDAVTDSVGGLTVELTRVLLGGLSGTASPTVAFVDAIKAGSALLSVGYSMSFLTQFVRASVSTSVGMVSGHFNA